MLKFEHNASGNTSFKELGFHLLRAEYPIVVL